MGMSTLLTCLYHTVIGLLETGIPHPKSHLVFSDDTRLDELIWFEGDLCDDILLGTAAWNWQTDERLPHKRMPGSTPNSLTAARVHFMEP
jgi:hypothetical protein